MVADGNMPGQLDTVVQYDPVADLTVVRQVRVRHEPIVVAHPGHPRSTGRCPVEGAAFPDRVVVANLQPRRLVPVPRVLWWAAQRRERMDPVVAAEAGVARDNHACADPGTGTDLYVLVNDCVGADLDVGSELRVGMDDGSRVNEHLTVARSSGCASAPISMPFESDLPRSGILAASGLAGEAPAGSAWKHS